MAHFQYDQLMDTRIGILLFLWVGMFLSLSMCMYEYRVNRDWNELLYLISEAEMAAAQAQQAAVKSKQRIEALRIAVKQKNDSSPPVRSHSIVVNDSDLK